MRLSISEGTQHHIIGQIHIARRVPCRAGPPGRRKETHPYPRSSADPFRSAPSLAAILLDISDRFRSQSAGVRQSLPEAPSVRSRKYRRFRGSLRCCAVKDTSFSLYNTVLVFVPSVPRPSDRGFGFTGSGRAIFNVTLWPTIMSVISCAFVSFVAILADKAAAAQHSHPVRQRLSTSCILWVMMMIALPSSRIFPQNVRTASLSPAASVPRSAHPGSGYPLHGTAPLRSLPSVSVTRTYRRSSASDPLQSRIYHRSPRSFREASLMIQLPFQAKDDILRSG